MTEAEWLTSADPKPMLLFLNTLGIARIYRKQHLLVAAICRHIDGLFDDEDSRVAATTLQESVVEGWQGKRAADRSIAMVMNLLGDAVVYEQSEQERLAGWLRDLFGPLAFRDVLTERVWFTSEAVALADQIYNERAFDRLPGFGNALGAAGCTDTDILAHCRSGSERIRGCWVVDLLLDKA